jgi:hypothetical protein
MEYDRSRNSRLGVGTRQLRFQTYHFMSEVIQLFVAGVLAGVVMTCVLFAGAFFRALRGWERCQNRIEDLETQLEQLQSDQEDWK